MHDHNLMMQEQLSTLLFVFNPLKLTDIKSTVELPSPTALLIEPNVHPVSYFVKVTFSLNSLLVVQDCLVDHLILFPWQQHNWFMSRHLYSPRLFVHNLWWVEIIVSVVSFCLNVFSLLEFIFLAAILIMFCFNSPHALYFTDHSEFLLHYWHLQGIKHLGTWS